MRKYKIALLPGDGIGQDVMIAGRIVLDKINLNAQYFEGDIGWEFWINEGDALPKRTIELLKNTDCALFGAITSKPKEEAELELSENLKGKGLTYISPIVRLRQMFDLYQNIRPCKAYIGNPLNHKDNIDIVIFRENTEDLYTGVEYKPVPREMREVMKKFNKKMGNFDNILDDDMALSCRIITRKGARRIIKAAFEYARKHKRKSVTLVEKPNVLRETSGLMLEEGRKIAKEYPEINYFEENIDAVAMWLLKKPENYSVIVTSNMFGDIISDEAAQLVGGLGFASSGNIGENYAIFEPTHGSAPKYAKQYKVNPIAMLLAIKLMLDWLDETEKAQALENAIAEVIRAGKVRTYDMGGNSSTLDLAKSVACLL